jgi:hypothetical protein
LAAGGKKELQCLRQKTAQLGLTCADAMKSFAGAQ